MTPRRPSPPPRLVKVPDVPIVGRCGKQKLEPPQAMIRCWLKPGHKGRHSWQQSDKIGEADKRVKR